ncbi:MAG: 30S ribosomal protein S20 [Chloroflexi bacterium RBG_16_48_7]|nr:MAG: 30S ribosomal protein S20 [Chloroflexi bacterium RBG_16_48_7]
MPRTKTAERAAREAEAKRQRNRGVRSATKTYIDKAEGVIAAGDVAKAKVAVKDAISRVDKAVKSNIIHPNTAAHRKSSLMKKLNKAFGGNQTLLAREAKAKKATKKPAAKKVKAPVKKKATAAPKKKA